MRQQIEEGSYKLQVPVKIGMMVDLKAIYMVGEGELIHDGEGFRLTGCDGKLEYTQSLWPATACIPTIIGMRSVM